MEQEWQYLSNQFEVATRANYRKTVKLSNYHMSALVKMAAENPLVPLWTTLVGRYQPMHNEVTDAFTSWKISEGSQVGSTLNVDQLLAQMTSKLNIWDPQIQVVYNRTSPEYQALFPQGRKPFQQGAKDIRIEAVNSLAQALQPIVALAGVHTLVNAYYMQLDVARDAQGGNKAYKTVLSQVMENARVAAMTMQYRDLGLLMDEFYNNHGTIKACFDLVTLREPLQTTYTATLDAGESHPLLVHTFMADEEINVTLFEDGGPVALYLASFEGGTDSTPVIVPPHGNVTFTLSDFGALDFGLHRYLTVINQGTEVVRLEVELEG